MFNINSAFWRSVHADEPYQVAGPTSRETRIAAFNAKADSMQVDIRTSTTISTTLNYHSKTISKAQPSNVASLVPIFIKELQIGVTHQQRVLYARIVSHAMCMNSVMVLIEDNQREDIAELAVYGLPDPSPMKENRCLAIIEPHYKIRQDGSPGIRVDNPEEDIVWDVTLPSDPTPLSYPKLQGASERLGKDKETTLEDRLQQIFIADPKLGVDKAFHKVSSEGYNATKKQVRALKKTILEKQDAGGVEKPRQLLAILSERREETHRTFSSESILALRRDGKEAFEQGDFKAAEAHFSGAIDLAKTTTPCSTSESGDSVALWQLIGNRSSARYKLGKLDKALEDALKSHRCAPQREIKPVMKCAELMAILGMQEEARQLLTDAVEEFPDHEEDILKSKTALAPKQQLRVGPNREYRTVFAALRDAQTGAEILVDPGVYSEELVLTTPVTLRSAEFVPVSDTLEGGGSSSTTRSNRPEIRVTGFSAVTSNTQPVNVPLCVIGFKIVCQALPYNNYHAVDVRSGVVVLRNTILESTSGPVVCLQERPLEPLSPFVAPIRSDRPSRLIMHSCRVSNGAQGGIIAVDRTTLSLRQVHVTGNAAAGLELREGGSAWAENCHFYGNGRQGMMIWKSAGILEANNCWIHSHAQESGALVSEGEAIFESCEFYGNGSAGVVAQQRGVLFLKKCSIHDNCEGVLIQDTGSASVLKCDVFQNRANGIFVGFSHVGEAVISENTVHGNVSAGILIGNKGKKVKVGNNVERDNKGLPPQLPNWMQQRVNPSRKNFKRIQKNKATIQKAFKEQKPTGGIMDFIQAMDQEGESLFHVTEEMTKKCFYCGAPPPSSDKPLSRCSRCKEVKYCSTECQRKDWPRHKIACRPKDVKYPSFVNPNQSV